MSGGIKLFKVNGDENPLDFLTSNELAKYYTEAAVDGGIKKLKDDNVTTNPLDFLTTVELNQYNDRWVWAPPPFGCLCIHQ